MREPKPRRWDWVERDDPAAGLVNLFDVWMVFAIALLVALVTYVRIPELAAKSQQPKGVESLDTIDRRHVEIEHLRSTDEQVGGEGIRLGTAYRLKSGEIVYVPESTTSDPPAH